MGEIVFKRVATLTVGGRFGKRVHMRRECKRRPKPRSSAAGKEAAKRALEEADIRKREHDADVLEKELGGRKGPEPTRYGDWEKKGITSEYLSQAVRPASNPAKKPDKAAHKVSR